MSIGVKTGSRSFIIFKSLKDGPKEGTHPGRGIVSEGNTALFYKCLLSTVDFLRVPVLPSDAEQGKT